MEGERWIIQYLNICLLRILLHFADKIEFTTEIDSGKKEFIESVFSCGDNQFNKVSFLYGANGSGKTFFCKIIREIQRLLEWSPLVWNE